MSIQRLIIRITIIFFVCNIQMVANAQPKEKDSLKGKTAISLSDFQNFSNRDSATSVTDARLDSIFNHSFYAGDTLSAAYRRAQLAYETEALQHRKRVFEWQLSSSKYIFVVVNIIVLVGLLLSVWQFYLPIYKMNKMMKGSSVTKEISRTVVEDDTKKETQVSTIKLGKDGVEITSPVIGLLILVISIAFYFMYINFVYPVSEIAHP